MTNIGNIDTHIWHKFNSVWTYMTRISNPYIHTQVTKLSVYKDIRYDNLVPIYKTRNYDKPGPIQRQESMIHMSLK